MVHCSEKIKQSFVIQIVFDLHVMIIFNKVLTQWRLNFILNVFIGVYVFKQYLLWPHPLPRS